MIVYKYPLDTERTQHNLPLDAKFLSVQVQHDKPQMWFLFDEKETLMEQRNFRIVPTGERFHVSGEAEYLGTFQLYNGGLVFHLFELV